MPEKLSICILYGVNEGSAMSKRFRTACLEAGFTFTMNAEEADIIFAHSGGCFLVPLTPHQQVVFLVGIPLWPGKPWLIATMRHLKGEAIASIKNKALISIMFKWAYRAVYFWKLPATFKMGKNQSMKAPWNNLRSQIVVRNRYDEYCGPNIVNEPFKGLRTFISLGGNHDDCWDNPTAYLELIKALI